MSLPLATLRCQSQLVWLHDPLALPPPQLPLPAALTQAMLFDLRYGRRLRFAHEDEALGWLGFWRADLAAMLALRNALQKTEPSAPVFAWQDGHVLARLANALLRGALAATESPRTPSAAVLPAAPATPAPVDPPAVPVSQLLAMPAPPPPLLPLLEELQIEGAEVLPEIEQSLEQVDLAIGEIELAPVSLEPTPSRVPAIDSAMSEASASVNATLGGL